MSPKKVGHFYLYDNFSKREPIFVKILHR